MATTKVLTDPQHYTKIANAIREKNGTSNTYIPSDMASAILEIETGGSSSILLKTSSYGYIPVFETGIAITRLYGFTTSAYKGEE